MTAVAPEVGIDLNRPRVPFTRLVGVELRKLADTRAGKWLLGAIAAISVLVMVIMLWVVLANDISVSFKDFLIAMSVPMGVLLPVLGVLSVTSEWSQRTALVTFTLEPHRGRVLAAKVAVGLVVALFAVIVAAIAAAFGNVIAGAASDATVWNVNLLELLGFYAMQALGILMGLTFGALLLSSPAAIVVYFAWAFVIPTIFQVAAAFIGWFEDLLPWIDFATAQTPLFDGGWTGEKWAQLLVSGTIWLIIPFIIGARRVLRSEIK
ncbi:ABC transporter permease subunit [Mumia zhuanghuii]|uniref:ABC transporter permease subunit n=2 Tax=Mumia TaxID=1546255 RepID=A0ABW1QQJ5_9ACTN|nr:MULTISPECIES: ABC transporter permease subunit [Mumia]KAA1420563.1 ABC transporter permease subunit [Mumia zhuanghuii]